MSWPEPRLRRRTLLVAAALLPAGCGFRPLYAPPETAATDPRLATIQVAQISERLGQLLTIALRDSFNPSGARVEPQYVLYVTLTTTRRDTAIRRDATASRAEIDLSAAYQLVELRKGATVMTGVARSFDSIDLVDNEYANIVASSDARNRGLRDLAAEIQTRCAGYLQRQATVK
jgi:LPS-assembly lipoprotein